MFRERFLVKAFGDDVNGTAAGLRKLFQLLGNHDHVVIVVPQMKDVMSTMLVSVLGEDASKKLIKDREILVSPDKKISLCSHATLKNYSRADAYLALWGSKFIVAEIEALSHWRSFVLVTWLPEDSAQWEVEYNVSVIYRGAI